MSSVLPSHRTNLLPSISTMLLPKMFAGTDTFTAPPPNGVCSIDNRANSTPEPRVRHCAFSSPLPKHTIQVVEWTAHGRTPDIRKRAPEDKRPNEFPYHLST